MRPVLLTMTRSGGFARMPGMPSVIVSEASVRAPARTASHPARIFTSRRLSRFEEKSLGVKFRVLMRPSAVSAKFAVTNGRGRLACFSKPRFFVGNVRAFNAEARREVRGTQRDFLLFPLRDPPSVLCASALKRGFRFRLFRFACAAAITRNAFPGAAPPSRRGWRPARCGSGGRRRKTFRRPDPRTRCKDSRARRLPGRRLPPNLRAA